MTYLAKLPVIGGYGVQFQACAVLMRSLIIRATLKKRTNHLMTMRVVGPTCHSHMTGKQENAVRPRAAAAGSDGGGQSGARARLSRPTMTQTDEQTWRLFFFLFGSDQNATDEQ